jgi:GGDEF domain-containing protein
VSSDHGGYLAFKALCRRREWPNKGGEVNLTGLAGRRMLGRAFGRLDEGGTVIMIDLDHNTARDDLLCHRGGDQFAVVLRAGADPEAFLAYQRAEDQCRPQGQDLTTRPLPESGEWRYSQVVEK